MFENQTADNFDLVYRTKVTSTSLLDQISRSSKHPWTYFVTFSSITSGRGNKGQTNYGFANSCMENICEARRRDGLSGVSMISFYSEFRCRSEMPNPRTAICMPFFVNSMNNYIFSSGFFSLNFLIK